MTSTEHGVASEQTLVVQAGAGQVEAFEALYRRHAESAWQLASAIVGDLHRAGEVVAEAFGRMFTAHAAGRYSPESAFRPHLLTTVRDTALDLERSRRTAATEATPADEPRTIRVDDDELAVLATAFGRLPERWRSTLWLTSVEAMKARDVAPVVGLSPAATSQLVGRADRGLREQFLQAHVAATGSRNCSRAISRLGAYDTGALDGADAEKLERHLRLCEPCTERHHQLTVLRGRLGELSRPLPPLLVDHARKAWTAAIATSKERTATGLSATTEKLLAGVSAIAAAAGVVGAAMLGDGQSRATSEQAAPIAPVATETDPPAPLDLDEGLDIPAVGATSGLGGTAGVGASRAASGSSPGDDGVVQGAGSGTAVPSGNIGSPSAPPAPAPPPHEPRAEGPEPNGDDPVLHVGTEVGGVPIAVDVGTDPGVTAGPVSVGSQPQPGDESVSAGGEAAPLDPVLDVVDGTLGLLGN